MDVQWILGHCNLYGNEQADFLAKKGSVLIYRTKRETPFLTLNFLLNNFCSQRTRMNSYLKQKPNMEEIIVFCIYLTNLDGRQWLFFVYLPDMIALMPICIALAFLLTLPVPYMTKETSLWTDTTCKCVEPFMEKTYGAITLVYLMNVLLNLKQKYVIYAGSFFLT